MRRLSLLALIFVVSCSAALAQGAILGGVVPFRNASGGVASGAKLCTLQTGSSTAQATYSNRTLTTALPNPITLNSGGYPTTNGTTEALIYGGAFDFKFVLYNAGTGNTCNGSSVGSLVWTKDPVFDYGKTVEASVAAAVAALPVFASGTYTPTCTGISNIASITSVSPHNYRRVGDTVWVMGAALVDPTSTSTSSSYRCTIPIASDTSPGNRLRGVTNGAGIGFEMWGISSGANDEAYVSFYTGSDAGALTMTHYFMYEIH